MPEAVDPVPSPLSDWVLAWSGRYDRSYDAPIERLAGTSELGLEETKEVYRWKLRRLWPERASRLVESWVDEDVRRLTSRAAQCNDEMAACRLLQMLPGAGPAVASALLMAMNPRRYTVMDKRSLKSLHALGFWPDEYGRVASTWFYPEYLSVCRKLCAQLGDPVPAGFRTLRTLDRALFKARGRWPMLPDE